MHRSLIAAVLLSLLAAACAAPTESDAGSDANASDDTEVSTEAGDPLEDAIRTQSFGCEEGEFHFRQANCQPATLIDLDQIISGGPPPDGIPPIDDPVFESIDDAAEWLTEDSPVMVVDVDGDVRAYPLGILTWHEIVNDTVGGVPLVVSYCPLCNSGLVFERTIDGPDGEEVLDFGTSGRLYRSNLVMYDRQHVNLWTQFEGQAVVGERFLGATLNRVPAWLFGFGELTELHPDAEILSRETGHDRPYGDNPYGGYDAEGRQPFMFREDVDGRFAAMTRVVGVKDGEGAVAITLDHLTETQVQTVEVSDRPITVVWAPGQASALDTTTIDEGRDVGQTAAFLAEFDGEPVDLQPTDTDAQFRDVNSGSTFDLRGRGLDGPLEGTELTAVPHDDTFWFVWAAFKPDTEVVSS